MKEGLTDSRHGQRWCNTSHLIAGTKCNGCDFMEVLTRRHRFYESEHYYCNYRGRYIDPFNVDCPKEDDR